MPRIMSRTIRVQTVRTVAYGPNSPPCSLRTMKRTIRCSSVAQSVRTVAHGLQLFCRAVCVQCRAQSAALPLRKLCAMSRTTCCPNAAPQAVQSDADATCLHPRVVATATSRNAAAKRKTASGVRDQENNMGIRGRTSANFTVTLGLQVAVVENGVRKTYSARYYNPNTGRFMSRDPEDGDETDPKTLHKYVYANGDPVNAVDPTGRMAAEYALL